MTKYILLTLGIFASILAVFLIGRSLSLGSADKENIDASPWWEIQSVDTVKYSRDLAREKIAGSEFDKVIDLQVGKIASAGVTHVALGTPYDKEFLPFLEKWVATARRYNLKVWFRGNYAGWEGWFDYGPINREEHIEFTRNFIVDNARLFENGDIFSPCTECENGGPGDPRFINDVRGYRKFLTEEFKVADESFRRIGKNVVTNYPMNGDVAKLVMDKATTKALGDTVVIDHCVNDPATLRSDIAEITEKSGGRIIIGEIGAPVPGIHPSQTEKEQAAWLRLMFEELSKFENVIGVNYWVSFGGATSLWNDDGKEKEGASVLTSYFKPKIAKGRVINEIGQSIEGAKVKIGEREGAAMKNGRFAAPYVSSEEMIVTSEGYKTLSVKSIIPESELVIVLVKESESFLFKIVKFLKNNPQKLALRTL